MKSLTRIDTLISSVSDRIVPKIKIKNFNRNRTELNRNIVRNQNQIKNIIDLRCARLSFIK